MEGSFKFSLIGLVILSTLASVDSLEVNASAFVSSREKEVREIAEEALRNFYNTCGLVSACQQENCSRVECHPTHDRDDHYNCVNLTNAFNSVCVNPNTASTSTRLDLVIQANVGRGYVRIPSPDLLENVYVLGSTPGNTVCAQRALDVKFKEIYDNKNTSIFFNLFFGAIDGTFRYYPGREILSANCSAFDPRKRPWFIGAISVKVDVIVLLDTGSYMRESNFNGESTAFDLAQSITTELYPTLKGAGRLTILPFNASGITSSLSEFQYDASHDEYGSQLPSTIFENPAFDPSASNDGAQSNFTAAFIGALNVSNSGDPDALKVVFLFTDLDHNQTQGPSPTAQENETASALSRQGSRLFIYDLGFNEHSKWSSLACSQIDGYYEQLGKSYTAVQLNPLYSLRSGYFNFLARSRVAANNNRSIPYWQPNYQAASGIGNVITVSQLAMSDDGQLIGVAAIDIQFYEPDYPGNLADDINTLLNTFTTEISISTYPAGVPLYCQLQGIKEPGNSSCGNPNGQYKPLCTAQTDPIPSDKHLKDLLCHCGSTKKFPVWITVLLAIGGGAAFLPCLLFLTLFHFKRKLQKGKGMRHGVGDEMPTFEVYSLEELQRGTNGFDEANVLGRGEFGVVFKGIVGGVLVAVKMINKPADRAADFLADMRTRRMTVRHENLVELKGACFQPTQCFLVYELVRGGDLNSWLFPTNGQTGRFLTWSQRIKIAKGLAQVLNYLHAELPLGQIFHLDVKPANVLLDDEFNPKLADFGISKICEPGYTRELLSGGTPGYADPEAWKGPLLPNSKLDVYSYGMVLLQLMSGLRLEGLPDSKEFLLPWARSKVAGGKPAHVVDKRMLEAEVNAGLNKKQLKANSNRLVILALQCLSLKEESRPEMKEVLKVIDSLRSVTDKKDFQSSDATQSEASERSADRLLSARNGQHTQPPQVPGTERHNPHFATMRSKASYRRRRERNKSELRHVTSDSWGSMEKEQELKLMSSSPTESLENEQEEAYYERNESSSSRSSPDRSAFLTASELPISNTRRSRVRKNISRKKKSTVKS